MKIVPTLTLLIGVLCLVPNNAANENFMFGRKLQNWTKMDDKR